jgi:hypothetical protein
MIKGGITAGGIFDLVSKFRPLTFLRGFTATIDEFLSLLSASIKTHIWFWEIIFPTRKPFSRRESEVPGGKGVVASVEAFFLSG